MEKTMTEPAFLDSKEVITREWLEQLKPQEVDEAELRSIDDLCAEWEGRTVGEFARYGLDLIARDALNERMLPHVTPMEMDSNERFIAWKYFKTEVIRIAAEHEGQIGQVTMDAVFKHYRVSESRKHEVRHYVARALQIRHNAISGVPFADSLPQMGALVPRRLIATANNPGTMLALTPLESQHAQDETPNAGCRGIRESSPLAGARESRSAFGRRQSNGAAAP